MDGLGIKDHGQRTAATQKVKAALVCYGLMISGL